MLKQLTEREKEFKRVCKVIELKYEYPNYTGCENWAIISVLSEKEIIELYADIVNEYLPFVLLTEAQGTAIFNYNRNEHKFAMRNQRKGIGVSLADYKDFEDVLTSYVRKIL